MARIQITTPGIRKALKKYTANQAVAEYIWNGFDAGATCVEIVLTANEMGYISELLIKDNGRGIPAEELSAKFTPFFETEKALDPNIQRSISAIHGKNGVGRLTFFQFALNAKWETVYQKKDKRYRYCIEISSDKLHTYTANEPYEVADPTGTIVSFTNIYEITEYDFNGEIIDFLEREFGWFLELNRARGFCIKVNDVMLDYSDIVGERENFPLSVNGANFEIRYMRWNRRPNEYSKYYYIDSNNQELCKDTTTLNNKGDHFYHSVFIKSDFFDEFVLPTRPSLIDDQQMLLFGDMRKEEVFKELLETVDAFLRRKRKPFLKGYTDKLLEEFEKDGAFPAFGNNGWDLYRKRELEEVIRELYQVEPKIFSRLNKEQKRTFVHLLDLIIDVGERDKLLEVLAEIVSLDSEERVDLAKLLETTKLSNVIHTMRLIEDRYRAIEELKALVFNPELRANERDHIQKFIEAHYWIFGEQYNLTSADKKFEEALRKYLYILRGEKREVSIEHPHKNREMDIFLVRQIKKTDVINNIVVELKHPNVRLGEKELSQVKRYLSVIRDTDEFNSTNMFWEFFLVGNRYDTSGYIEGEMENVKRHGEKFLVYSVNNQKIYVRTWSDIFTDFELRHNFLYEKLEMERHNLVNEEQSADEIIQNLRENTAANLSEIAIPE